MPKGKILMGKGSPKPKLGDRTLPRRGGGAVPKRGPMVGPKRKKLTSEQMRAKQASGKNMSQPRPGSGTYKTEIHDIVYRANDPLNRKGFVVGSKKGNTIKSTTYGGKKGNYDNYNVTENVTTLGKGGRRERTLTTKYVSTPDRQPLGNGEFEIYGNKRNNVVVKEVQHNRGTVRKGAVGKKKAY